MVSDFEQERDLFLRRQRRGRLADDLLEDVADDAELEAEAEETVEEVAPVAVEPDGDVVERPNVPRVVSRTPLEMEEWGAATPEKQEEAEPEIVDQTHACRLGTCTTGSRMRRRSSSRRSRAVPGMRCDVCPGTMDRSQVSDPLR